MKLKSIALMVFLGAAPGLAFPSVMFTKTINTELHGTKVTGFGYIGITDQMRRQTQDIYALLYGIRQSGYLGLNGVSAQNCNFSGHFGHHR